jgi:uncharacterized protein
MKVDLNSFDREKAIDETLAADTVAIDLPNARVIGPLRLVGKSIKNATGVGIKGRLSGSIEIDCDRCLEPVDRPFDIELDLEFAPKQQLEGGANLELHADDLKLDAIEGRDLDLAEIAREQVLLDLPHQFFCKDECKGLCAKCGTNLNLKDCDCGNEEIDPRWASLKDLN